MRGLKKCRVGTTHCQLGKVSVYHSEVVGKSASCSELRDENASCSELRDLQPPGFDCGICAACCGARAHGWYAMAPGRVHDRLNLFVFSHPPPLGSRLRPHCHWDISVATIPSDKGSDIAQRVRQWTHAGSELEGRSCQDSVFDFLISMYSLGFILSYLNVLGWLWKIGCVTCKGDKYLIPLHLPWYLLARHFIIIIMLPQKEILLPYEGRFFLSFFSES